VAVRHWLEICGAHVTTACSVGSALTRVRHEAPDLMLLDVRLPDGTGWDLLQRLRATVPGAADVRVVAMTACRGSGISEAAQRHGVRHVLTKPIAPAALAEALSECLDAS
jgi:CheY-like chemotaxis protein